MRKRREEEAALPWLLGGLRWRGALPVPVPRSGMRACPMPES